MSAKRRDGEPANCVTFDRAFVAQKLLMAFRDRKSLLDTLLARLRGKPAPAAPAKQLRPFQAISIYCGLKPCVMAKRFRDHRFLAKDAPQLPLIGCTATHACDCRYLKHTDRRAEHRRFADFASMRRDFAKERRQRAGRRVTDRDN